MSEPYLIGESITGGYGTGPAILHECTVAVDIGEIAVIVGPNGAGKSTAMKALFGMLDLSAGSVRLDGQDITSLSPQDRVARGMAFVPQTSNIFTSMTVEENLEMGAFLRRDDIFETIDQIYQLFPILGDKRVPDALEGTKPGHGQFDAGSADNERAHTALPCSVPTRHGLVSRDLCPKEQTSGQPERVRLRAALAAGSRPPSMMRGPRQECR